MKTAGNLIRQTRLDQNLEEFQLGEMTHIRTTFIEAIENSDWDKLPELAVVIGFVKSISHFLDIDERQLVALLKREYKPPTKIEKQKEISKKFIWGPRLTFLSLVIIILIIVLGYLGFQYKKFNSPPKLIIKEPTRQEIIKQEKLTVSGITDLDATVEVNNQSVLVNNDGSFKTEINLSNSTKEIKIIATSRSGKTTSISRTIEVKP